MNPYILASTGIGAVLFVLLCVQVLGGKPQNLASWILFELLTAVAAASVFVQNGNYMISLVWAIGNTAGTLCIIKLGKTSWGRLETAAVLIVLVCLGVWAISGPRMATIATSIAFLTAGIPQIRDTWHEPWNSSLVVYFGFAGASALSVVAGKDWSVEQRLFPSVLVLFNSIVGAVACRKFWLKQT